jgi:hypothetical protein
MTEAADLRSELDQLLAEHGAAVAALQRAQAEKPPLYEAFSAASRRLQRARLREPPMEPAEFERLREEYERAWQAAGPVIKACQSLPGEIARLDGAITSLEDVIERAERGRGDPDEKEEEETGGMCPVCGRQPAGPDGACEMCASTYSRCPYCGAYQSLETGCVHNIASWNSDEGLTSAPFDLGGLPRLSAAAREAPVSLIESVFGELTGVALECLAECRGVDGDEVDAEVMFRALLPRVTVPVESGTWEGDWMGGGAGRDWFAEDTRRASMEIQVLANRMLDGFRRLEESFCPACGKPLDADGLCPDCDAPRCADCGERLEENNLCPTCNADATRCPYCGSWSHGEAGGRAGCEHYLAGWNDDQGLIDPPFDPDALPVLPANPEAWSDAQKRAAFGDLRTVAQACEDASDPGQPVDAYTLYGELVERLAAPLSRVSAGQSWAPGLGTANVDWYTPAPERARAELAALVARLAEGFRRLQAMPLDETPDPERLGT